jgi:PhoH-like ATPase
LKKTYVLDTNILLDSPNAIFGFDDNDVVVTGTTLQELDSKKTASGDVGYHARESIRILDSLRQKGNLLQGIQMDNGGTFRIVTLRNDMLEPVRNMIPASFRSDKPDNMIIETVLYLKETKSLDPVLVTNDVSLRINASICGIEKVEFYRNNHLSSEQEYTGRSEIEVSSAAIQELFRKGATGNIPLDIKESLTENEFLIVKCGLSSALGIWRGGQIKHIKDEETTAFGVAPKNAAQRFALYALLAPVEEIPFVILKGAPGTAKTFLSLAAGLDQTYDSKADRRYDRVLISRNNVMADEGFGYLPGDMDDKMGPLLAPFFDNLESLLRGHEKNEDMAQIQVQIDDMLESKVLDICPLAYMRGRSLTHSFLIVDETQNASRSQIRDIITRAGEGTKVVICGDPDQIDSHMLDRWNNGLVFASKNMKGSKLCAQVTFLSEESVRSELAKEATKRLVL